MSTQACCPAVTSGDCAGMRAGRPGSGGARVGTVGSWIGPSAVLVLLPKCPMCLAAYLALAGIGVSARFAAGLRAGIVAACMTLLGVVVIKSLVRVLR